MHPLAPNEIASILFGLGVLLLAARIMGELAMRFRQPVVIGEIFAGVLLGPTVLGRFWHQATDYMFPEVGNPAVVLHGITIVAVVLFLLVAGMEVDLSTIFRQGRAAMTVGIIGTAAPFAIGLLAVWLLPGILHGQPDASGTIFALFFATALAISSLPVIAKTLMDLNLYRTDLGMVVIAAAVINDLVGWIFYAIVLGSQDSPDQHGMAVGGTIGLTLLFLGVMLTIGRWGIHQALPWLQAKAVWPAGVLGFAMTLALLGAAFTQWIGIHAVFGSFIVGVALGDSSHLRERTRNTIDQFVSSVFAPLFFASIGLTTDFIAFFDVPLVLLVLAIATVTKVLSCGLGARWARMPWRESWAIGFGLNARGAMGLIFGLLGKQMKIIDEKMFVALVVMAVVTSMVSGSIMPYILKRKSTRRFSDFLNQKGFINPLQATRREAAIKELSKAAGAITGLNPDAIASAVLQRERMMPTGLGLTVAVPHARMRGMNKPVVCVGISREGIEFEAPDGERARMIFLILTPAEDDGAQLEILADISRTFLDAAVREGGMRVSSYNEFIALLKTREPKRFNANQAEPAATPPADS